MLRGSSVSNRVSRRSLTALAAGVAMAAVLSGCTGVTESPAETTTPSSVPSAPVTAKPTPEPALMPKGTAADNLPLFTKVTERVWASKEKVSGRAYVDALVAAGFDKKRMQVTEDLSTVGNPSESLQFSVAWGKEECLVGQIGPSTGDPVTAVMDQLAEDRCLIGNTRDIDW